jgi:hypothetical protein
MVLPLLTECKQFSSTTSKETFSIYFGIGVEVIIDKTEYMNMI